jgi:peptidoglycan/xylan/chitin deacetylase (PgdA/CDA1 family)
VKKIFPVLSGLLAVLISAQSALATDAVVIHHGDRSKPAVALTFDDCNNATAGAAIRNVLYRRGVHATFFCLARAVNKHPDLMRQLLADGNEFGNHSISHPNFRKITEDEIRHQICDARTMIDSVLGAPSTNFLRPPYGRYNDTVLRVAGECGYTHIVLWSIDTRDWSGVSAAQIASTALKAQNGAIIIMHMGPANTPLALPKIIKGFRARGIQMVKVSEMIAAT